MFEKIIYILFHLHPFNENLHSLWKERTYLYQKLKNNNLKACTSTCICLEWGCGGWIFVIYFLILKMFAHEHVTKIHDIHAYKHVSICRRIVYEALEILTECNFPSSRRWGLGETTIHILRKIKQKYWTYAGICISRMELGGW